jgi:hypothetical protein
MIVECLQHGNLQAFDVWVECWSSHDTFFDYSVASWLTRPARSQDHHFLNGLISMGVITDRTMTMLDAIPVPMIRRHGLVSLMK